MAEPKVTTVKCVKPSIEKMNGCGPWDTPGKWDDNPDDILYTDEKCPEPTKKVAK